MQRAPLCSSQSGMTMVELLISLAIFVAVLVSIGAFEASVFSTRWTVSSSFETAQDAQIILKTMVTELRAAAPAGNGAYAIASAGTSSISFFSDPLDAGVTEEITYSLVGTTLYRSVILPTGSPITYPTASQSTSTLMTNVRNGSSTPLFQYYDQNYTGTSSPLSMPVTVSSVRLVEVSIVLDTDPTKAPAPRTYTTQISLRNLKTNL